jgi:hypothetical protein
MSVITVSAQFIELTLHELQEAGRKKSERVILWLGQQGNGVIEVEEVFVPLQFAEADYFRIPRQGISALLTHLRQTKRMIAAQVHSHPQLAFHSLADDRWAIVRHVGALSLVLPYFALRTTLETFRRDAAVFELSTENEWMEVPPDKTVNRYSILQ